MLVVNSDLVMAVYVRTMRQDSALGFLLFRTTGIQMNVETKARVLFNEIEESFPCYYTARIGVLF